jgi:hypothetical protein
MFEFIALLEIFVKGDGPGLLLFICSSLTFMILGNIVYRANRYILAYHLPEDKPAKPIERWWSGLVFAIRIISQVLGILKFFLPMAAGIILLSLAQLLYLTNPEIMLWSQDLTAGIGLFLLSFGVTVLILGEGIWMDKLSKLDPSLMIYFAVRKIDIYAIFFLSGISITFFVVSHLTGGQFPFSCAMISIIIAVGSLLIGILRLSNPSTPEPFDDLHKTRNLRDSGFRFSKPMDPANTKDPEWWRTGREDIPPAVYDPDFKFPKSEDAPPENGEKKEDF